MPNNEKRVSTRTFVTGRDPLLRLLSVSEGGLEPPRPIKGTSTSS
jgi:hypothetical protein